jgi:hypothetical protein
MHFVQVFLLSIGQQSLGHLFRYQPFLLVGWRIVKIVRNCQRKTTNTAPTTVSAMQVANQSTFINAQLYSTYD